MAYDLNCVCFTPIPQTIHQKKSWTQHGPALFPQLLLARMRLPRCQPWMWSVPLKLARWNPSLVPRNNGLSRMYGKQTMLRGIATGCLSVWAYPFHSQSWKFFMKQKLVQLYHIVFVWLTTVLTSWRGHHFYFVVGLERTSAIVWKPFGKRFAATILDTQFMRNMQMSWTKLFLTAFMEMKVKGQSVLPSWIFRLKHPWDWICLMKALPLFLARDFKGCTLSGFSWWDLWWHGSQPCLLRTEHEPQCEWAQLLETLLAFWPSACLVQRRQTSHFAQTLGACDWGGNKFFWKWHHGGQPSLFRCLCGVEGRLEVPQGGDCWVDPVLCELGEEKFAENVFILLGRKCQFSFWGGLWVSGLDKHHVPRSAMDIWSICRKDSVWFMRARVLTKTRPLSHHEGRIQQGRCGKHNLGTLPAQLLRFWSCWVTKRWWTIEASLWRIQALVRRRAAVPRFAILFTIVF